MKSHQLTLTTIAILSSIILLLPMTSQNVFAVEATLNQNVKPVTAVTPQENDPQIAANGKLAVQLSGEIDAVKTKLKTADSSTQVKLNAQLSNLEKQLDYVKQKMQDLGVPTIEEFNKDPKYWISKAAGVNMTPKTTSSISPLCTCPYMQFEEAFAYPCYGIFTCDAYYPAWSQLGVGQGDTQILGVANNYSWITPFWLVQVNGASTGDYSYQYTAYDNLGRQITSDLGSEQAPSSSYQHTEQTIYNVYANSALDTYWYVNHIP